MTAVSLRPYHRYALEHLIREIPAQRANSGISHAIRVAIEEAAQRRGITKEEFEGLPDRERYAIGAKN